MKSHSQVLAALLLGGSLLCAGPSLRAQQAPAALAPSSVDFTKSFGNTRWFPNFWGPYEQPYVPEMKMTNSERLHSLMSDGKLRLSLQDIISLALEE